MIKEVNSLLAVLQARKGVLRDERVLMHRLADGASDIKIDRIENLVAIGVGGPKWVEMGNWSELVVRTHGLEIGPLRPKRSPQTWQIKVCSHSEVR